MKFKSIITCGLLLLGVGAATTSCEDMFTPENKLVTTDLAPQDTLYQVMGIIQRMQKLADRTVLLGEVRADLLEVDKLKASLDIQELAANNVSLDNVYNQPQDYYAVINNCNIYLAGVDSARMGQGTRKYYADEILAVKCFRAWCYLELTKIYGQVPFITTPIIDSDTAEDIVASGQKADMGTILSFCISDIEPYLSGVDYVEKNNDLRQDYGKRTYNGILFSEMMIPFRALLAELYLWKGSFTNNTEDFKSAVGMYHDFFTFPDEEIGVRNSSLSWDKDFQKAYVNSYTVNSLRDAAGVLPLDTSAYYGNYSDLRYVFNSMPANDYYPSLAPSQRIKDISAGQEFCYFSTESKPGYVKYGPTDPNAYQDKNQKGDLRFSANYNIVSNHDRSQYNGAYNSMRYYFTKYTPNGSRNPGINDERISFIPFFRTDVLYLHLAEALNRAGFPETAFAVLANGLSAYNINDTTIVSTFEYDQLDKIPVRGFALKEPESKGIKKAENSFVVWPTTKFDSYVKNIQEGTISYNSKEGKLQIGIHSIGCGDVDLSENYTLDDADIKAGLIASVTIPDTLPLPKNNPTAADSAAWLESLDVRDAAIAKNVDIAKQNYNYLHSSEITKKRQARVAQLILDEEALECMFEGNRFYDLMRYQMQEGKFSGTTIELPAYISEKYPNVGTIPWQDNMTGKPWYLTLPTK